MTSGSRWRTPSYKAFLQCLYIPTVQSHASTSVCTLKNSKHWQPYHCPDTGKYCTHRAVLLSRLLCLIQVKTTWISHKGQRNTWKKLHDSWCCTLFALHFVPLFCFVEFSYSWKVFPATANKKTGVSCHRTTEAEKIVRTFIVVHHFGMLPFAFALLLPLLAVFLLLRLSSRPFPCSRHKSSSNQQGQSKYF